MGTLNVTFVGVCTHFRGVVPGIPHRVVLADASALRFGIVMVATPEQPHLTAASTPDRATYYTMPHFPVLRMRRPDVQERLSIQGVMKDGNVYSGVRLSIPNAVGAGMEYAEGFDDSLTGVTHITQYVDNYAFSPEVVLGGNAAVYFDLFSAVMVPFPIVHQAIEVTAQIQTIGAPELLATPFFGGPPQRIPLVADGEDPEETVELWVANQGMDCETAEASFDYLLHYLTRRNGIPRRLTQSTPGMNTHQTSISPLSLIEGAAALTTFDYPAVFDSPCLTLEGILTNRENYDSTRGFVLKTSNGEQVLVVSLACSNSQYP